MSTDPPPYSPDKGAQMPPVEQGYPPQGYSGQPSYGVPPAGYPAQQGYPPPGPGQPSYGGPPTGYPAQQGYPPMQPGYPAPPPGQQHQTIVVQPPVVVVNQGMFGEFPIQTTCPHCRAVVSTSTMYETGTLTWLIAGILLFIGCWLGCCLIPFCVDGCKDVIHSCPSCHQIIGRYRRI